MYPHRQYQFITILFIVSLIFLPIPFSWAQDEATPEVTPLPQETPFVEPSPSPTDILPTLEPTPLPTETPAVPPTVEPTLIPTAEMTEVIEPTPEMTALPTVEVTPEATATAESTLDVTLTPTFTETPNETALPIEPMAALNTVCDLNAFITRASIASDGTQLPEASSLKRMSTDGRYLIFNQFREFTENGETLVDVYIYDGLTCQSTLLPNYPKDLPPVAFPGLSTGRYVVHGVRTDRVVQVEDVITHIDEVYVYDQISGQDILVSKGFDGSLSNHTSGEAVISGSGRYVAYRSFASNLVSGDVERCEGDGGDPRFNCPDLFLYDMQTGQNIRFALMLGGDYRWENLTFPQRPAFASSDRFVVYELSTRSCDVYCSQIALYEIQTGQTIRVPMLPDAPTGASAFDPFMSATRYITYAYYPGPETDGNPPRQIVLYDMETGQSTFISKAADGTPANGASFSPTISGDGRYIAYGSNASNLVNGDSNGVSDVFLYDRLLQQTRRMSVSAQGAEGNAPSGLYSPILIGNTSSRIAFESEASNLVDNDSNEKLDVFVTAFTVGGFTEPPGAPILNSPADRAIISDNTPLLNWSAAANAEDYHVLIDNNSDFSSPIVSVQKSYTDLSYTPEPLPDGQYYWRIESRNSLGTALSTTRSFKIITILPDAPQLQYPANPGYVSSARPAFSWFAVPTARRYRIQVATDEDFTSLIADTMEESTVKAPVTILPGRYFWHVQTQSLAGVWGAYSETRYFEYALMQTPVYYGRSYGAFPIFTWNAYPGARRYQLEILSFDLVRPISVCTLSGRVLSSRPCGLPEGLPYGDYYWRVNLDLGNGFIQSPIPWPMSVTLRNMPVPDPISPIGTVDSGSSTLNVRAWIDGRSQLVLQGNTVFWHHFDFAAPGRHFFNNEPTILNGVAWFPIWPDIPDAENRDCDCFSSAFSGVPTLPAIAKTIMLNVLQARGQVTIVQQPNQSNNFTLIIEFDDNPPSGPDWYEIDLTYPSTNAQGSIIFQWSAEAGVDYYEVGTASDATFHNLLSGATTTALETELGQWQPGRYYWRVRAWFPGGKPGIWSETVSFEVLH